MRKLLFFISIFLLRAFAGKNRCTKSKGSCHLPHLLGLQWKIGNERVSCARSGSQITLASATRDSSYEVFFYCKDKKLKINLFHQIDDLEVTVEDVEPDANGSIRRRCIVNQEKNVILAWFVLQDNRTWKRIGREKTGRKIYVVAQPDSRSIVLHVRNDSEGQYKCKATIKNSNSEAEFKITIEKKAPPDCDRRELGMFLEKSGGGVEDDNGRILRVSCSEDGPSLNVACLSGEWMRVDGKPESIHDVCTKGLKCSTLQDLLPEDPHMIVNQISGEAGEIGSKYEISCSKREGYEERKVNVVCLKKDSDTTPRYYRGKSGKATEVFDHENLSSCTATNDLIEACKPCSSYNNSETLHFASANKRKEMKKNKLKFWGKRLCAMKVVCSRKEQTFYCGTSESGNTGWYDEDLNSVKPCV